MSKRAIAVMVACFLTIFVAYGIRYSYGTLLPEMLPALQISKAEAGIIFSSYFVAYTVLAPVLGIMSDRYDVRIVLAVFMAVMAAGTLLMAFPTSILQASLFFTLAGIGCSACWAPVMGLAGRWAGDRRKGMTLAFVDAGSSLGIVSAGAVVPLIVVASDWRMGWVALGAFAFLTALLNFLLIRDKRHSSQAPSESQRRGGFLKVTYAGLFRDTRFWLIGLAYMLTGFSIIIPFTFLSTYAVQELSFSYESATRLITAVGVAAVVGKMTMGPISDKIGRIRIMMICAVFITTGTLGISMSRGWILLLFTIIFGAGYGGVWAMYAACASDFFSKQAAGGIIGIWTFYLGVGTVISPIVGGWLGDTTGTLTWSFMLAAGGGLVSLLLLLPMWKASPSAKK